MFGVFSNYLKIIIEKETPQQTNGHQTISSFDPKITEIVNKFI